MSIRGYQHELRVVGEFTDRELNVYITETGWEMNRRTRGRLARYVLRAYQDVWLADERVLGVTPFLLNGAPGPFAEMSYYHADGSPSELFWAFRSIASP